MTRVGSDFGSHTGDEYLSPIITNDNIELIERPRATQNNFGHHQMESYTFSEEKFHPDDPANPFRNRQVNAGGRDYHRYENTRSVPVYTNVDQHNGRTQHLALTDVPNQQMYNRLQSPPPAYSLERPIRDSFHGNNVNIHGRGNTGGNGHADVQVTRNRAYSGNYEEPVDTPHHIYEEIRDPPPYSPTLPALRGSTQREHERAGTTVKSSSSPNLKSCMPIFCGVLLAGLILFAVLLGLVFGLKDDGGGTTPGLSSTDSISSSATQKTTTFFPTDTQTTSSPEGWSEWTSWSECSLSCGGGQQERSRTCPTNDICRGTDVQARLCQTQKCSGPNYGKWATWQSWQECSDTCGGGTQSRIRACNKSPEQIDCPGEPNQQRSCSEWDCPNCADNSVCPDGCKLDDDDCIKCINDSNGVFSGKVTSLHLVPLEGVKISDIRLPNEIIATTNESGHFTIEKACEGISLLMQKENMEEIVVNLSPEAAETKLGRTVSVTITQHPQNKVRLVGEDVTLCCSANGIPAPEYIEWFKDNVLLDTHLNDNPELVLKNIQKEHSGYYKCRANNKYGAIYSEESQLRVEETPTQFCSVMPSSDVIPLPTGCTFQGSATFDRGTCNDMPCRHYSEVANDTCGSKEAEYRCGPIDFDIVNINCKNGMQLPMILVTKCDCTKSKPIPNIVVGRTLKEDGSGVGLIEIWINGIVMEKSVMGTGEFRIVMNDDKPFIVLTAYDSLGDYYNTTKIIHLKQSRRKVIYKTITLIKQPAAIDIDSQNPEPLMLGGEHPFAALVIQANSLYTQDGDIYQGTAKTTLGELDPRSTNDMLFAPSDLVAVSREGSTSRLNSKGMFSIKFTDTNKSPLVLGKPLKVVIDSHFIPTSYSEGQNNFLWSLNTISGQWEPKGTVQNTNATMYKNMLPFSTSVAIGDMEIEIETEWNNFDLIASDEELCYFKVKTFKDDRLINPLDRYVLVSIVIMDPNDPLGKGDLSSLRAYSDDPSTNVGEYCIASQCDKLGSTNGYYGYILVEDGADSITSRLNPAQLNSTNHPGMSNDTAKAFNYTIIGAGGNNVALHLDMNMSAIPQNQNGPLYNPNTNNMEETECSSASDNDNYVSFYKKPLEDCHCEWNAQETVTDEYNHTNYLAFYARSYMDLYDTCFVKIQIQNGFNETFKATSIVGNLTFDDKEIPIEPGVTHYGVREQCPLEDDSSICLEIKYAGVVFGGGGRDDVKFDNTLVHIEHIENTEKSCQRTGINVNFETVFGHRIVDSGDHFKFYKEVDPYGPNYGIFCTIGEEDGMESAKNNAFNRCAFGEYINSYAAYDPRFVSNNNAFLTYECQ